MGLFMARWSIEAPPFSPLFCLQHERNNLRLNLDYRNLSAENHAIFFAPAPQRNVKKVVSF
jgi:hypothetical protein